MNMKERRSNARCKKKETKISMKINEKKKKSWGRDENWEMMKQWRHGKINTRKNKAKRNYE